MAFPSQQPLPYNKFSIEQLRSGLRGCYGIFRQGVWIYVGKSDDIRARMLDHINGDNPCISRSGATHFVLEVTLGDPSARERQLILECSPSCNQRVG